MKPFIQAIGVSKHYDGHTALDKVSVEIHRGRVFGLLGPNGAGKTSLIRIITRITAPDSGQILMDGEPLRLSDVSRIGYLPEERGLYPKMKVGEQAVYLAQLKGMSKAKAKEKLQYWFERLGIESWWNKRVQELSKGMQQKVQFVCTVIHDPELLIFDEPFSGFDPVNAEVLKREILELKNQGRTIIFSTHNMQSVEEICDDIALINRSRLVLSGSVSDIRRANTTDYISISFDGEIRPEQLSGVEVVDCIYRQGQTQMRVHRASGQTNRELIGRLPEGIELLSFNQETLSMNEIFLQTVGNSYDE